MKALVYLIKITILLLPITIIKAENKSDSDKIVYTIKIDQSNIKIARVSMTFMPKDNILYMAPGAASLPDRWATFVQNIKAVDEEGTNVVIKKIEGAKWVFASVKDKKITLTYQLVLEHENYTWSGGLDGAAYATAWGVFYTGRSLLVLHGNNWQDIKVNFELPASWKVTTPWTSKGSRSFVVNNQTALAQSLIFAGTHEELSFKRSDFELVFALGGEEVRSEKEDYKNLAEGVMDYYIQLMGGVPNPAPDDPLKKVVVVINAGNTTDGEVIGNNISMLIEKEGDDMSKMISKFIFAHEFFHLWNGKSFRPENDQTEWFKEGFSNYYTLKALYQVGFLDEAGYYETLNSLMYKRYNDDEGVGRLSMTRGEDKHDHWGLIYSGGLFVAMAQDMIIRNATNNKKSVDDLMKMLFIKYGGTTNNYSLIELQEVLTSLSGMDQTGFFKSYVIGSQRTPIATYLSMASLEATIEENNLKITKKEGASNLQEKMTRGLLGDLRPKS